MINANTYKFIYNLNDKTKKWLDNAKAQIKENGQDYISYNKNNDIFLKTEEVPEKPIYDKETTAKIQELEKQIELIKSNAIPINKDKTTTKQTLYVKHIGDNITNLVDKLLNSEITNLNNNTINNALQNLQNITTNIK